jgi:hypothetical protein
LRPALRLPALRVVVAMWIAKAFWNVEGSEATNHRSQNKRLTDVLNAEKAESANNSLVLMISGPIISIRLAKTITNN